MFTFNLYTPDYDVIFEQEIRRFKFFFKKCPNKCHIVSTADDLHNRYRLVYRCAVTQIHMHLHVHITKKTIRFDGKYVTVQNGTTLIYSSCTVRRMA